MPFGLTRLIPTRVARGAGTASADTAGTTYTVSGLKVGSSAILYGNGTQIATATVDSTGKATWTLGSRPAIGTVITYDGVVVGSGGTVTASSVTPSIVNGMTLSANTVSEDASSSTVIGLFADIMTVGSGRPGLTLSNLTIAEDAASGTTVGTFS